MVLMDALVNKGTMVSLDHPVIKDHPDHLDQSAILEPQESAVKMENTPLVDPDPREPKEKEVKQAQAVIPDMMVDKVILDPKDLLDHKDLVDLLELQDYMVKRDLRDVLVMMPNIAHAHVVVALTLSVMAVVAQVVDTMGVVSNLKLEQRRKFLLFCK